MAKKPVERRKVLTICGDRGWHDPDTHNYDAESVDRGFRGLNDEINRIGEVVTIHSVSYAVVPIPSSGQVRAVRIYATIVYSGDTDPIESYGRNNTVFEDNSL